MKADSAAADMARAVERIRDRRAACRDSELESLPDDPDGVVRHVIMHRSVAAAVLERDLEDAAIIAQALRIERDRRDLGLLRAMRSAKWSWARIAQASGFRSRQGAEQMVRRLEAAQAEDGQRDERLARAVQAAAARKPLWLAAHVSQIHSATQTVMVIAERLPEVLHPAIADLAEELEDPDVTTAGLMSCLGWIIYRYRYDLAEYRDQDLDRVAALVAEYQAIG